MIIKSKERLAGAVCAIAWLVSGCAGPVKPYEAPVLELPPEPSAAVVPVLEPEWWRAFNDPVLNAWVQEALARNWDVLKAATQVAEAQAGLQSAQALNSPRLDAVADVGVHQRRIGLANREQEFNQQTRSASVGAALSWEWDLWGRVEQVNAAAQARAESAEQVRQATALSVAAWVSQTYFQWRTLQDKWRIAQSALQQLDRVSELERRRWQAGLGTELAYRQTLAEAASVRAQITPLEAGMAQVGLALQALAGRSPRELTPQLPDSPASVVALPVLPSVVDTRVLLRRPDVAAAEWGVQAEHANWNVSQAQRYPRLSLNLVGGLLASSSALISGLPLSFEATAGAGLPIFDGGALDAQVQAAQARRERAVVQYRQTVMQAHREVHDAVLQVHSSDRHAAALLQELGLRQQALALAQRSYQAGRSSQYEVLSETVKVLQVQWAMSDTRQSQWVARSQFYKAMGGGL
jgi:multidrug efflux system outer membrane protein